MPTVPYLLLDVFTDTQFEGNPLAVVIDPPALTDELMARIARELNLSETIFLRPAGAARWATRIFTPASELPFAGHPTVGAAVALAQSGFVDRDADGGASIVLAEVAGDVPVTLELEGDRVAATFVAPRPPELVRPLDASAASAVLGALGLGPDDALGSLAAGAWSAGVPFTVVPLASLDALASATVDAAALAAAVAEPAERFVYLVTPGGDGPAHWRARMYATGLGIAEDPATGSAACAFAGLLATAEPDGDATWLVEQGVEMGRRSVLRLAASVVGGVATEARLGGTAVAVGSGTLDLR